MPSGRQDRWRLCEILLFMEPPSSSVVLLGAGALDRSEIVRHLAEFARGPLVVLPTAAAFTGMEAAVAAAAGHFVELGLEVEGVMAASRADANNQELVARIENASFVWICDGSPLHLKTTLRDTLLLDALHGVINRGGMVAASGAVSSALCDPMIDPRGGAPMIGLGLVTDMCVVAGDEATTGHDEMLQRTLSLVSPTLPVVVLSPGTGLSVGSGGAAQLGDAPAVFRAGATVIDGVANLRP